MGDGTFRGDGFPVATWQWGFLTKAQRDQLRQVCSGKSAVVFIQTRENDTRTVSPGVTTDFRSFQATMIWPDKEEVFAERRIDFTLEFRFMVAQ